MTKPLDKEDAISQIPALQLLQNLGYEYLTPDEAVKLRGGRLSNVLLEGVLVDWLRANNHIRYRNEEHAFSEGNIQSAVQALRNFVYDGLVRTNEKIYDLLCLGKSLQQSINGDVKSFPLKYIDWEEPGNNVFHVTEEFVVERTASKETRRPDIVLFVNGIPFVVIECKRPSIKDAIEEAVSQNIRNQRDDEIPKLFVYTQLLMGVSKNEATFGTTGTPSKFWGVWKEATDIDEKLADLINTPLSDEKKTRMFSTRPAHVRKNFDALEAEGPRDITEQDRVIYALCSKERLLEMAYRYIVFDAGQKKIARYQQYFTVKNIIERIKTHDQDGRRKGGVVWHTQGSGKSLTMVMLAKAIALADIPEYKVVLVTDRVDLDDQIYNTFRHCGLEPIQARTGKHLIELVEGNKKQIVTTIIDKFEAALSKRSVRNEDRNIFVLVDEGHRTQYGPIHAKMRKVLPNACYIAFTGTPVMKKNKNTIQKFGGLIAPAYTIKKAVEDKAVVRLLYEGRHVEQDVDSSAVDSWFERITERLTPEQKTDLKRKFSTADQLNKAEQKILRIAWDISVHFRDNWQGTPFKAQLVTQDKAAALRYKANLDECGMVSSEVLISGPDDREGNTDIQEENEEAVIRFWGQMMKRYGNEKEYNKQLINAFKFGDEPEIIIVVSKLLTGFDAPRNTVLYITRKLEGHSLLQAIARVNRLHDGKDFGYIIDYYGVLSGLHEALDLYGGLPDFDEEDLAGTLTDVSGYVDQLPQKRSDVWDIFKSVANKRDEEAYERLLADDALRDQFYERLSDFSRCLAVAISTVKFIEDTPEEKIEKYKSDLKFFMNLRTAVRRRYGETVDFKEYEKKIQKLIDTHVGTGEVEQLTELVDIFDEERFSREVEKVHGAASQADTIAHRTKKTLEEKWKDEDPASYRRFSRMLKDVIDDWRAQRLSDVEYLNKVKDIMTRMRDRTGDDVPEQLQDYEVARSFFGVVRETFEGYGVKDEKADAGADISLKIDQIIQRKRIVNWETNPDVQNQMRSEIEDVMFELKQEHGIDLSFDDIDKIMDECIDIAKVRYPTK